MPGYLIEINDKSIYCESPEMVRVFISTLNLEDRFVVEFAHNHKWIVSRHQFSNGVRYNDRVNVPKVLWGVKIMNDEFY